MKSFKIIVSGKVQGVGYRFFVSRIAEKYHIKGYVKNILNGDVKIIAVGTEKEIKNFIEKIKTGHIFAKVSKLKINEIICSENYIEFSTKY